MIDRDILRDAPEIYARDRDLKELLTPAEREEVQEAIVARFLAKLDDRMAQRYDVNGRLSAGTPSTPVISGRWAAHRRRWIHEAV